MRISHCFIELIAYVIYFRAESSNDHLSFEAFRDTCFKLIDQSKKRAEEADCSAEVYDNARFAVFVWIDETIMKSSWQGKGQWKKNLLQRQFYKTSGGGVEFYKRLEALEPEMNEVREVYYFCLVSGFSGAYGTTYEDYTIRDTIKTKQLKRLTGTADGLAVSANDVFFTSAYCDNDSVLAGRKIKKFGFSFISSLFTFGPLFIFVFLFILYRFILNNEMITKLVP